MHGRLRARPGAVVARRHPGRLQRQAPGARHGALRADHGRRHQARPGDGRGAGVSRVINGPEAFTPDNEFILGESEVGGFFVAAGFSAHGIAGAGGIGRQLAQLDRRRRARARPVEDGHPPVRRGVPVARYTLARSIENYATYYDIHYPNEERQAGPPAAHSPDLRAARGSGRGRSARSRAGSGRTGSTRTPPRGERGAPAARLGGRCIGRPRSAPRRWRRGRRPALFDESVVRQARGRAGRARPRSSAGCAPTTSTAPVGSIVYTQLLNRRGGIEAT